MKKLAAALLAAGLVSALLTGCGGSSGSQQSIETQAEQTAAATESQNEPAVESTTKSTTGSAAESTTDSAAEAAEDATESSEESAEGSYKIYVLDASDGTPIEGAMVQLCSDTLCMTGNTDEDGLAVFDQEPGDYTTHLLRVPEGYEGSEEEIQLTADERVATYEISGK